jgi:hypothetical protein
VLLLVTIGGEPVAMAGYERIPDYNDSPHADRWYERRLS